LLEDARNIWPDFPTSPLQMDPVIHMIFKAFASRLKDVNDRINSISDSIIRDLACRIFFDGLLHPVPSSTILKLVTGPNPVEIDELVEAYWVNTTMRQSQTLYFSPVEPVILSPCEAVVAFARNIDGVHLLWTDPQWKGKNLFLTPADFPRSDGEPEEGDSLFMGIKATGSSSDISAGELFVSGGAELCGYLRWGHWRTTQESGVLGSSYVPAEISLKKAGEHRVLPEISLWGYGYFPFEHKGEYEDCFFNIPEGKTGKAPVEFSKAMPGKSRDFWDKIEPLYWVEVHFDRRVPSRVLKSFELAATNCIVGINTHFQKQSFFYHGPGPMMLELQSPAAELYDIVAIDDNHGREYQNIYAARSNGDPECRYVPRIDGDVLMLLVSPPSKGTLPDRLTVSYRTSIGAQANGIGAGLINSLYNPHPGIESIINLTESRGGVNSRNFDEMIESFPNVLRSRNRAIVASDFEALAMAFDGRIKSARARQGSTIKNGILTRCVELEIDTGNFRFVPDQEARLFLTRLERYLEMRSPIGTVVAARII